MPNLSRLVLVGALLCTMAPACGGDDGDADAAPAAKANRFNATAAYRSVKRQVQLGPRPAGSRASRKLAARLRSALPRGRYSAVPGGLRNVVGTVRGREPKSTVVIGAHYDTKDMPGFVGANDGASGTAILTRLARTVKPGQMRPTLVFIAFDGEENPPGKPDAQFGRFALRGSKAIAPKYREAEAMILLDFVGEKGLRLPREGSSNIKLWAKVREAARRAGVARVFPDDTQDDILDDHTPFIRQGVPSVDLIDFDFPCFHRRCDNLSRISKRSLDAVGETMMELLPRL